MKPQDKEYILKNIANKSIGEISAELGLKDKKVKKFLEHREKKDVQTKNRLSNSGLPSRRGFIALSLVLIIVFGLIAYVNALNNKFLWDDLALVERNRYITSWEHLPQIFTQGIGAGFETEWDAYRPVQILTYMMDYSLWTLDVRGYHFTNIILHIFAAISVYWLICVLFQDNLLAFLTGIFFVVHPVHTEAVTYISGRSDLLSLLFMMLCFVFYIKSSDSKSPGLYIAMLLSYALALLSRENSIILPALLLLYHYSFKKGLKAVKFLPIMGFAAFYIVLRLTVLKGLLMETGHTTTLWDRLPGSFVAFTNYIRLLFLPFNLHMEYGHKLFNFGNPKAILGVILLVALSTIAFKSKKNNQGLFFAILWFILTLLPVANLYHINAYMAEHWLYLPSIGFFFIMAKAISKMYRIEKSRVLAAILLIGYVTFYSYLTIRQNTYWREPLEFYIRTLKYADDSERMHNNLGLVYSDMNRQEEAIAEYKKAINIKPNHAGAHNNLGRVYFAMGRNADALASYKKAIEINPHYAEAYNNLGLVYDAMDKKEESIRFFKKATEINPYYAEAYNNLGVVYYSLERMEEAVALYEKALEINVHYVEAYSNLANAYNTMGRKEDAIRLYNKAIEVNPKYAQAYYNLATTYFSMDKKEDAIVLYKKAAEITPNFLEAYNNLGAIYNAMDRKEEAIRSYMKVVEINPRYVEGHYNLGVVYDSLNRRDEAIMAYMKAIEIDSGFSKAYRGLASIYFHQKQYQLAIAYCDKAKELGLTDSALLKALKPYRESK